MIFDRTLSGFRSNSDAPCGTWGGNNSNDYIFEQLHVRANSSTNRVVLDDGILDQTEYVDDITNDVYRKIRYHDSKLTDAAPWSDNQRDDIIKVFRDNPNKNYIEFEVRSSLKYFEDYPNSPIQQGDKLRIYREDVYKSISNGDGGEIAQTIKMNDIGFQY